MRNVGSSTARHRLHSQGRFSCSVGTNNGDTTIETDIDIDRVKNLFALGIGKADFVQLQKRRRNLFGIREPVRWNEGLALMITELMVDRMPSLESFAILSLWRLKFR